MRELEKPGRKRPEIWTETFYTYFFMPTITSIQRSIGSLGEGLEGQWDIQLKIFSGRRSKIY